MKYFIFRLFKALGPGQIIVLTMVGSLVLSGCQSISPSSEVSFGETTEIGPVIFTSYKIDEKIIGISVTSEAAEALKIRVSYPQTTIGRNYDRGDNYGDTVSAMVCIDPQTEIEVAPGESKEMTLTITNWNHVTADFQVVFKVAVRGAVEKWNLDLRVEDLDFFAEPGILHEINEADNWHPKVLEESWDTYLQKIS
jgi:hypothetical protein